MVEHVTPDFRAQFRSVKPTGPHVYMGGTTIGCGDHPTAHKRHRWNAWRVFVMPNPQYIGRERMCLNCGLMSDVETKAYAGGKVKW